MATLNREALRTLQAGLKGCLILPGDKDYESARLPWLRIVDPYPALIVEAAAVNDIALSLLFARQHHLPFAAQATGHGIAKPCDGGLLLNLSKLKSLTTDATARQVRIGPGIKWSDLLAATKPYGLVAPSGQVSNVGVVGYALGGGIGWLVRKHGAACHYVSAATVVLATGEVIRVSANEHPDLFWALRGGGGNFGVVAELEMRLLPEPEVLAGLRWYPLERATELLALYRHWTSHLSENTSTVFRFVGVPDQDPFPASLRKKVACAIGLCHADSATADALLKSMDMFGEPALDQVRRMPYMNVADLDPASHEASARGYGQAAYLNGLQDEDINQLIQAAHSVMPPLLLIELLHLGGCFRSKIYTGSAFNASAAEFMLHTEAMLEKNNWNEAAHATQDVSDRLASSLTGELNYNFLRGDQQPEVEKAFAKDDFMKLRLIKQRYDPNNVFNLNLNIKPAD